MAIVKPASAASIRSAFDRCSEIVPLRTPRRIDVLKTIAAQLTGHAWTFQLAPGDELWSQVPPGCCGILTEGSLEVHHRRSMFGDPHRTVHAGTLNATCFFGVSALAGHEHTARVTAPGKAEGLVARAFVPADGERGNPPKTPLVDLFMSERSLFEGLVENMRGVIGRLAGELIVQREVGPEQRVRHAMYEMADGPGDLDSEAIADRVDVSRRTAISVLDAAIEAGAVTRTAEPHRYAIADAAALRRWCKSSRAAPPEGYVAATAPIDRR